MVRSLVFCSWLIGMLPTLPVNTARAGTPPHSSPAASPIWAGAPHEAVDLAPAIIQESPVFQRWLQQVPNVLQSMKQDPSFKTRLRLGYTRVAGQNGVALGVEDIFLGQTGLTLSADYQGYPNREHSSWGGDLRYYLLPLGNALNVAPVFGYRSLNSDLDQTNGLNVGVRLQLVASRTGAADLALTQTWLAPRSDREVGLTTLSFGYAVTQQLRLSTDIQQQNARQSKELRIGLNLEWMF